MITAQIAIANTKHNYFEYNIAPDYQSAAFIGCRVLVSVRNRETIGVLIGFEKQSKIPVKKLIPILKLLDDTPLITTPILKLCRWVSDYYHAPLGDVIVNALPAVLRRNKPLPLINTLDPCRNQVTPSTLPTLNSEQAHAVDEIKAQLSHYHCFLLNGVTGSGKTEVYFHCIDSLVKNDQQILILVPEIGLTPQMVDRVQARFSVPISVYHSGLNNTERAQAWLAAKSGSAKIIIGTRSAIFIPIPNLAMIIVDEEHDTSFKQIENTRYHARDVAIMRAQQNTIPIILGSATPSLESLHNVARAKFSQLILSRRAGSAIKVKFEIIDLRRETLSQGLSRHLLTKMSQHLTAGNQVLLFLNRRGFAPVLRCSSCGWIANCPNCDMPLTLHTQPSYLQCHHCACQQTVPHVCPDCQSMQLAPLGIGTERIERILKQRFPSYTILRMDRDSTRRKHALKDMLDSIQSGDADILLGTQMLAKGHHFSNVTLVGIVDADSGFFCGDFRAPERLGQLILQVSGRAGRAEKPGEVAIQTHQPDHPLLHTLITQGYDAFSRGLLQERQMAYLPPHSFLILLRSHAKTAEKGLALLQHIHDIALSINDEAIELLGPVPAPQEKLAGHYRAQLLIKSLNRIRLQNFLNTLRHRLTNLRGFSGATWCIDVDPIELF